MPLYAGELNLRRGAPLAEFPAPLSEVLRAQAQETHVRNPTTSGLSFLDRAAAERGEMIDPGAPEFGILPQYAPVERLDAETARARVKDEGLPLTIPDDGISKDALDILIRRKREELQRQDVFSRGPTGVLPGAARLGTALAVSLMDPLNIASAFIPVVGPERAAALIARAGSSAFGRAATRFGIGAVEGATGAALLEPLVYAAAQAEQADYTMADSLTNIAFGGLFGGGLHVAGGAVRDIVQPGWWRMAERTETPSVADTALTRTLDAAPEAPRVATRAPEALDAVETARRIVEAEQRPGFQRSAEDLLTLRTAERTPEVERAAEILKQEPFQRSAEDRVFLTALEKGHEADYINERVTAATKQLDEIDRQFLARGNSPESEAAITAKQAITQALDRDVARLAQLGRSIDEAQLVMQRVSPETRAAAMKAAVVQAVTGRNTEVDAVVRMDAAASRPGTARTPAEAFAQARAAAEHVARPEAVRVADFPAAVSAAERLKTAPRDTGVEAAEAELREALRKIEGLSGGIDEKQGAKLTTEMKPYDDAIADAKNLGNAARVAASCGL